MPRLRLIAIALAATTALSAGAYAAEQPAAPAAATTRESAAQKAVDKDVGKLSVDGAQGFREMQLARIAIFNADPNQAKTMIGKAQASLAKAKTDDTTFMKAEADLKPPANATKPTAAPAKDADAAKPVAWLPVDGQLMLSEDYVATPQKAAAVADANKHLASGDQKGAVEKLKLAGIDVNYTMAVVPLAKTSSDVDQAAKLIEQGKYYEANAVLKQAEDGLRFDVVDATGVPAPAHTATKAGDAKTPAAPAKPAR